MLTMVESSTTMSCATPRRASTAQRLGSEAGEEAAGMSFETTNAARPPWDGLPAFTVMSPTAGQLVTETLAYDHGRQVTAYVPPAVPEAIVFAGDGQLITSWAGVLEA